MDETGAEIVQAKPEGNVVTRMISNLRRVLSGKPQNTEAKTPSTPQVPLEELKQDLANLEDIRKRGGSDFNDPKSRAQDDVRMEQLRTAIASRTPKPETSEQPTAVPVAPNEQQPPAEEPAVA